MNILFTTSDRWFSKLIQKLTGEPVSHVAIQAKGVVVHSSLLGVDFVSLEEFKARSAIVHSIPIPSDYQRLWLLYAKHKNAWYDFGALFYLALRCLFPSLVPKQNLWQATGMFLCTEWVTTYLNHTEDNLLTPYNLYLRLQKENE